MVSLAIPHSESRLRLVPFRNPPPDFTSPSAEIETTRSAVVVSTKRRLMVANDCAMLPPTPKGPMAALVTSMLNLSMAPITTYWTPSSLPTFAAVDHAELRGEELVLGELGIDLVAGRWPQLVRVPLGCRVVLEFPDRHTDLALGEALRRQGEQQSQRRNRGQRRLPPHGAPRCRRSVPPGPSAPSMQLCAPGGPEAIGHL